ncbi:protein FAM228A isoform X2 [Carcharodon carcharias]|uniref:protein FAM228A isoform X2 n=1 Tax=Carcharodon carcharias TaxID=13397 RepID=UPI001B7DA77F|nr:protein FAM228A isoform X2 [Carcharodon carcharias]
MSSRRSSSGHISVHRQFPCSGAISTASTCPMKSLSAQRYARIEPPEKCLSASVWSTEQNCMDWLSRKSFAYLQTKAVKESCEVNALCQPLHDMEECFIQELDKYSAYKDMLNLRRKELLYKKWNDDVYEPLQWKVKARLNQSIERRRPSVLQYLDYCDKKEPVFLEEYNPDDFNPFVRHLCKPRKFKLPRVELPWFDSSMTDFLHMFFMMTRTSTLNDPLLLQSRSKSVEDNAILQCQEGKLYSLKETEEFHKSQLPLVPLGRQNIDSIKWLSVPLNYIDSDIRQRIRCSLIIQH